MADQETISVYDEQVEEYLATIKKQPSDATLLDFISRLNANDYVLDLGCGPALSSATMREHGLRVDPTDASLEMVKLANTSFDINARQASFDDINEVNVYDGVWANFSLLHAPAKDFPIILKNLHTALKPRGLLHLGMKIGDGCNRDKLGRFYSYYSQEQLCNYLDEAGFIVQNIQLGEAMSLAGEVEPWIALRSTTK